MSNKLTIAALAVIIPLGSAVVTKAEVPPLSVDDVLLALKACMASEPTCTPAKRRAVDMVLSICYEIPLGECVPKLNEVAARERAKDFGVRVLRGSGPPAPTTFTYREEETITIRPRQPR